MSQAFRKSNKKPEVSDTTGFTPPTRVDEQKNSRRAQQINHLHQEFEDLKKKIKEVENKNEKIIEKIHKAYNFKKKNAYTEGHLGAAETSPVIHYQNRLETRGAYSGVMSGDNHSNQSDHSEQAPKMQKRTSDIAQQQQKKAMRNDKFNYSVEYGKNETFALENETESIKQGFNHPIRYSSSHMTPPLPNSSLPYGTGSRSWSQKKLIEQLNIQKANLEQQLIERENELHELHKKLKAYVKLTKNMFEGELQDFFESTVMKNMIDIEKVLKKFDSKLKNMKKMIIVLKDKQEDKKSSQLLKIGRERRSSASRSRRSSPHQRDSNLSRDNISDTRQMKDCNRSRSRVVDQEKSAKQFQQIACKYEELIKSKTDEIDKWDKKYRVKERECYELKMRVEILQKRFADDEKKTSKEENVGESFEDMSVRKKYSTDSNLLADIDADNISNQMEELKARYDNEIANLNAKIIQLEKWKGANVTRIQTLENKNKMLHSEYQQNIQKNKIRFQEQQEARIKQFEALLNDKNEELNRNKIQLTQTQKRLLEKECENYSLENKLKKNQALFQNKEKKIEELEKLLAVNEEANNLNSSRVSQTQHMEKNMLMSSTNTDADIKKLKSQIEKLEEKLEGNKNQIFMLTKSQNYYKGKSDELEVASANLKKQVNLLQVQNQQLKINANINNISSVIGSGDASNSDEDDPLKINDSKPTIRKISQQYEQKISQLMREKEEWYEKYQKAKSLGLQKQSELIKMNTELNYLKKNSCDNEEILNRLKQQNQNYKKGNKQLKEKIVILEEEIDYQKRESEFQINEIEKKWLEFEEDVKRSRVTHHKIDNTDLISEKSSLAFASNRNKIDEVHTQNQLLTVKLKQAEAEIETQKTMEQRIINEYKTNMEEYKKEIRIKNEQIANLQEKVEDSTQRINNLTMRLEVASKNEKDNASSKQKRDLKNQLLEKVQQLENELKQIKQINNKLTDMEGQLFEEIKIKEEERTELYEELKNKEQRIKQLEEAIEMKQAVNAHGSHISNLSNNRRETIKSQSSLKYSSNTRIRSRMHQSQMSNNPDQKMIELQLSEAGSQFFEQPSQISNISEIFEREEIPYEKMKIKRHEQIKLFEKTASYIKSLKKAMNEKNKRIKLLEKKIQSLRTSELVRKQLGLDIVLREEQVDIQDQGNFKDYQSVQLENRRGGSNLRRYKQLEYDTKLVMEQNNMLVHQIESLEEELIKAEQQENSLVKIKDLYKEEIKKLIKNNEERTKQFEEELRNQRKRVEESQSVHNIEAIKQLFIKIVEVIGVRINESEPMSAKKKEEKRKELEEYVKVMSNILKIDKKGKDSLLLALRK